MSPSSRGRGLKSDIIKIAKFYNVALFTRAWIEIANLTEPLTEISVALFTRAWIEMYT